MNPFDLVRADTVGHAVSLLSQQTAAKIIAGGTNLLDLMKENVERPTMLVDVTHLPLAEITETEAGLSIGALVSNSNAAYDDLVRAKAPLLASAILAGASPQLRNMASTGGNLLQRTRCYYFFDTATACNKREPGSGCSAIGGLNRIHAIFGASGSCIATHPSDMCVALAALDAQVRVEGPDGERMIPFEDFHRLPGDTPEIDTTLKAGEMIVAVDIPHADFGDNHTYIKIRDRSSYAFALVSVAAALKIEDGRIADARIALGGVAHKPWRDRDAEQSLVGLEPGEEPFRQVADLILRPAKAQSQNGFKITLARRAIVRALQQAAAGTPQQQSVKSFA